MLKRFRLAALALNLSLLVAGAVGGALMFIAMNNERANTLDRAAMAGSPERVDWMHSGKPPLDLDTLLGQLGPRDPDPQTTDAEAELRAAIEEWVWLRRIAHGPEGTLASVWCGGRNYLVAENEKMAYGDIKLMLTGIGRDGITVIAVRGKVHVKLTLGFHEGALPWVDEPYYGIGYPPEPIDNWEGPIRCPHPLAKQVERATED